MNYARFQTLAAYQAQDNKIVQFKNQQTKGEFVRTDTEHYYTPEPKKAVDSFYYMEVLPEFTQLFNGCTVLDFTPIYPIEP